MKQFILSLVVVIAMTSAKAADFPVTEEVKENFKNLFGTVQNVQWAEEKGNFTATFYNREIKVVAKFSTKGEFIHSLRYYKADGLPTNLRNKLNRSYKGKTVFGVTEVTIGEGTAYYVKMEDNKSWYTVKVYEGGEMETIERYKKI